MTVDVRPFPRLGWDPLPGDGVVGVTGRVLVREEAFFVAQLQFSEHATIHEHPGDNDTIVVCLSGRGFTSVAGETAPLEEVFALELEELPSEDGAGLRPQPVHAHSAGAR